MPRSRLTLAVHLAALCAFAVAQPLFEVVGNSPEFFVAHRSGRLEIGLLAVMLTVGLPGVWMLAVLAVDCVSRRTGDALGAAGLGAFAGAFALLALKRAFHPAAGVAFGSAGVFALLAVWAYLRAASVRGFFTILAVGVIAFPGAFFLRPAVARLLSGSQEHSRRVITPAAPHDVVFVIFDQFPVSSLIDPETGGIERRAYPAFAALADEATWFRNATAVNPITGWSVPAIVTGRRPNARDLPVAADHPDSLFSLLEPTHRMHVVEPITDLCPARVCPPDLEPLPIRLMTMLDDLSMVYLHVVLPDEISARLPPVTQNWRDFATARNWLRRWAKQRDEGRRVLWSSFVAEIHREDRPVLHYLHILLPHHPFTHLPGGQRYASDDLPLGLSTKGVWTWGGDDWLVTQGYERHLLQVAFVDRALGQLLARLREVGIYDDALIVVTADHGARFAPNMSFLNVGPDDFSAIMGVPLFIKRPRQAQGGVDDRNIESIDILPTIAEMLGTSLPWRADGYSLARREVEGRPRKELSYDRVTRRRQFDPHEVFARTLDWARRKREIFGSPEGSFRVPAHAPAGVLVGASVNDLHATRGWSGGRVDITQPWRYAHVDPPGPFVPAAIEGTIAWSGGADRQVLAVAINGVVRATTRTGPRDSSGRAQWLAIVPPSTFARGANVVEAFIVEGTGSRIHISHVATADDRTRPDLLDGRFAAESGIALEGFHGREHRRDGVDFRWTNGYARARVPTSRDLPPPEALDIVIDRTPPGGTDLALRVSGCTVFTGHIPDQRWSRTFHLRGCVTPGRPVTIEVESGTFRPGGRDRRTLGVALQRLMLY